MAVYCNTFTKDPRDKRALIKCNSCVYKIIIKIQIYSSYVELCHTNSCCKTAFSFELLLNSFQPHGMNAIP